MLVLAALFLTAAPVEVERRDRQQPELVVEAGGRTATCDALAFAPDGKTLFAAGDDKVVQAWPVGPTGIDAAKMRTLRWPAWREYRGGIKTLAVSPDGAKLVIGGFGTRASNGSAAVLNWPAGDVADLTVPTRTGGGSSYTVFSAAFSPDGKAVALGTADGAVWLWHPNTPAPARELGRHAAVPPAGGGPAEFNRPRLVAFVGKEIVSVAESGEVLAFDPAADPPTSRTVLAVTDVPEFSPKKPLRVFQAVLSPDQTWLAAGCNGATPALILRSLDGQRSKVLPLKPGEYVNAVAFSATTDKLTVAVGSWKPLADTRGFVLEADDRILIVDRPLTSDELTPTPGPKHTARVESLAFHPDGRLAVAGGDNHAVELFDLAKPAVEPSVARGAGRNLWGVRIAATGDVIGFQPRRNPDATDPNARGTGPWVGFDLGRTKPVAGNKPTWVEPVVKSPDGWAVGPTASQYVWRVSHEKTGAKHDLPWDKDRDEAPRCWTFLPPAKPGRPTRLAVGHMYGFSVFELPADGPPVRTVWARGHASEVMAIAPSADGTWVVTTGTDQTVAGWSVQDSASGNALGATLAVKAGKLVVSTVDVGGPAWEMGLVAGAEILGIGVREATVRSVPYSVDVPGEGFTPTGTPADGWKALTAVRPAASVFLVWREAGRDLVSRGQTTLPTRPLWRFFPAFDPNGTLAEWVVWVWKTGHYHTSTNGDFLIGWVVNRADETKTPAFYPAERLRDQFHREAVVRKFLQTRDLSGALTDLLGKNPLPLRFDAVEPTAVSLAVTPVGPDGATVTVDVPAAGSNPDLWPDTVEVWVNDHRVESWAAGGRAIRERLVELPPEKLRAGTNTVTTLTRNRLGGRAEAQAIVRKPGESPSPRLFGLVVGINDYSKSKAAPDPTGSGGADVLPFTPGNDVKLLARGVAFGNLTGARNDATKLRDRWLEQTDRGGLYAGGDVATVLDPTATRADVLAELDRAAKNATADDRFVLFLAGHGDYVTVPRGDRPARKEFVFCCQD
ncbi:MAG: hypothetical protein ACRC7O_05980, partial [Fimbriiglobus sp.]